MSDDGEGLVFVAKGSPDASMLLPEEMVPEVVAQMSWGSLVSKQAVEDELDMINRAIRGFWEMEPDHVFKMASAMSGRLTEMAMHLHRLEGRREWKQLRTMQVERIQRELEFQFKLHSRMLETRRQDIELSR